MARAAPKARYSRVGIRRGHAWLGWGEVTSCRAEGTSGTLPREKWAKFTSNIARLVEEGPGGVKAGFALEVIGQAMHASEIFPSARASFVPLSQHMGGLAQMSQHNKRAWARNMDKFMIFPPILCRMLDAGWRSILGRKRPAVDLVKIACDANYHIHCDWCRKGMGYGDMLSGDYEGIEFPDDH